MIIENGSVSAAINGEPPSGGGTDTTDATITADTVLEGYVGYGTSGKVTGVYNPEKIGALSLTVPSLPTLSYTTAVSAI